MRLLKLILYSLIASSVLILAIVFFKPAKTHTAAPVESSLSMQTPAQSVAVEETAIPVAEQPAEVSAELIPTENPEKEFMQKPAAERLKIVSTKLREHQVNFLRDTYGLTEDSAQEILDTYSKLQSARTVAGHTEELQAEIDAFQIPIIETIGYEGLNAIIELKKTELSTYIDNGLMDEVSAKK